MRSLTFCIFAVVAVLLCSPPAFGSATDPDLARARRTGREFVRNRNFARAISYLRVATGRWEQDTQLRFILSAALFDRAMELENELAECQGRYFVSQTIQLTAHRNREHFASFLEAIDQAAAVQRDALSKSQALRPQIRGLLNDARHKIDSVTEADPGSEQAALLSAWLAGYETIRLMDQNFLDGVSRAQGVRPFEGGEVAAAAGPPPNLMALRAKALGVLGALARNRPNRALPYLAAAEWLHVTGQRDPGHPAALERAQRFRYQLGFGGKTEDAECASEVKALRSLPLPEFAKLQSKHVIPLLERARELDKKGELNVAYPLYLQICAARTDDRASLLQEATSGSLKLIEEARLLVAEGPEEPAELLRVLGRIRAQPHLSRPLFITLPLEVRQPFLSANRVWRRLEECGFGYHGIFPIILKVTAAAENPEDRLRVRTLAAGVAALLMRSDLPQDWTLGARKRLDHLVGILTIKGLPDDIRAQISLEVQVLRGSARARPAPMVGGHFFDGQLSYSSAAEGGVSLTGACIHVDLLTGMSGWAPPNKARQ